MHIWPWVINYRLLYLLPTEPGVGCNSVCIFAFATRVYQRMHCSEIKLLDLWIRPFMRHCV